MNEQTNDKYFVGVRFSESDKSYYYSTKSSDLKIGDLVLVPTNDITEIAVVSTSVMSTANYRSGVALRPIIHKANASEIKIYENNLARAKDAIAIAEKEASAKGLPMDFVSAHYSFDGSMITLTYTSTEKRVDFRELLPVLGARLKARVNLRQIASRDRAKMIGGIGICGLPLCCSSFLTNFESIAISRMKNQMLAINIPKYSGPCDKLMCCLLYEDDLYTEEKKLFPRIGASAKLDEGIYSVVSYNIVSHTVRLANEDKSDFKSVTLSEWNDMLKGTYKPRMEEPKQKEEYHLPDFNITTLKEEASEETSEQSPENKQNEREGNRDNRNNRHNRNRNRNRDNRMNQGNRDNRENRGEQRSQNSQGNQNNNRGENRGNRPFNRHDRRQQGNNQNQNQNNNQNSRPNGNRPNEGGNEGQQNRNRHRFHNRHHRGNGNNNNGPKGDA